MPFSNTSFLWIKTIHLDKKLFMWLCYWHKKLEDLKVHLCRFENLPIWSRSCENNTLEISHFKSWELSSYLPVKFIFFVKIRLISNIFHCLRKQTFRPSRCALSQKVKGVIMWNFRHIIFHVKTKILTDFHIYISVPLITN